MTDATQADVARELPRQFTPPHPRRLRPHVLAVNAHKIIDDQGAVRHALGVDDRPGNGRELMPAIGLFLKQIARGIPAPPA